MCSPLLSFVCCLSFSFCLFVIQSYGALRRLHSFPTRRSSDLLNETTRLPAPSRDTRIMNETFDFVVIGSGGGALCAALTARSEEHTSELQSRGHLVCRLLLEKKKNNNVKMAKKSNITTFILYN